MTFTNAALTQEVNPKDYFHIQMKRMQEELNNLHPELSHFNVKQLRQQATLVASKGIILDAKLAANLNAAPKPSSTSAVNESSNNNNNPTSTEFEDQIIDEKDGSPFDFNIDQSLFSDLQDKFSKFYK